MPLTADQSRAWEWYCRMWALCWDRSFSTASLGAAESLGTLGWEHGNALADHHAGRPVSQERLCAALDSIALRHGYARNRTAPAVQQLAAE